MNIAINGFGRIGRNAFKALWRRKNINIVAVNDLTSPENLAYLLTYDSVYRQWNHRVSHTGDCLVVDGKKIRVFSEKEPQKLPWKKCAVDVVIESTGRFAHAEGLRMHLKAGAKRVVLSAPAKGGGVPTYVYGVNHGAYSGENVVNNASCTTNCVAPVAAVVHEAFGIVKAGMTTVHGYTAEQNLIDGPMPPLHKDMRRGRAAAINIVPTTTGAAIATAETIPELQGLFDGTALRVPVPAGSLSDFTFLIGKKVTSDQVNNVFVKAAKSLRYKGILEVSTDPLVSSDIVGTTASAIVDLSFTKVIDGDLVKVLAWYDNEWGYAHRLADMVELVGRHITH